MTSTRYPQNQFILGVIALSVNAGVWVGATSRDVLVGAITSSLVVFAAYLTWNFTTIYEYLDRSRTLLKWAFIPALSIATCYLNSQTFYFVEPPMQRVWLIIIYIVGIAASILVPLGIRNKLALQDKSPIAESLILLLGYGISTGHTVASSYFGYFSSLLAMMALGIGVGLAKYKSFKEISTKQLIVKPIYLFIFVGFFVCAVAAFRSDFLDWAHGSLFHWFYFVGPISEYQADGGLSALTQYSKAPLVFAGYLSKNPWEAFYILQASLYVILIIAAICAAIKTNKLVVRILILFILFLFLFADPSSVGPQAYPSSGLARFFPVISWAIYIYLRQIVLCAHKPRFWHKLLSLLGFSALTISLVWSAEMMICTIVAGLIIISSYIIARTNKLLAGMRDSFHLKISLDLKTILALALIAFFLLLLVIFNYSAITSSLAALIAHPLSYLENKYGWHEPGAWITISPVFFASTLATIVIIQKRFYLEKIGLIACYGLAIGYVYYRPVSNNITAILGSLLILTYLTLNSTTMKRVRSTSQIYDEGQLKRVFSSFVLAIGSTSILFQATNIQRLGQILNINIFDQKGQFAHLGGSNLVKASDCQMGDEALSKALQDKRLYEDILSKNAAIVVLNSIGFNSKLGLCHRSPEGYYHPFVFQPLALYNEPLPMEDRKRYVERVIKDRGLNSIIGIISFGESLEPVAYFSSLLPDANWKSKDIRKATKSLPGIVEWSKN